MLKSSQISSAVHGKINDYLSRIRVTNYHFPCLPLTCARVPLIIMSKEQTRSDFIYKQRYRNVLPEEPIDSLLLNIKPDCKSYGLFRATSLDHEQKFEIPLHLSSSNLLDFIELTDPRIVTKDPGITNISDQRRRKTGHKSVSWLRRTEYIGASSYSASGFSKKRSILPPKADTSIIESIPHVIKTIESSFESPSGYVHPTNPALSVKAVHELRPGPISEQISFDLKLDSSHKGTKILISDENRNSLYRTRQGSRFQHESEYERRHVKPTPNTFVVSIPSSGSQTATISNVIKNFSLRKKITSKNRHDLEINFIE